MYNTMEKKNVQNSLSKEELQKALLLIMESDAYKCPRNILEHI